MNIPLEQYRQAADYIRAHLTGQPEVCLVLGSGLGRLADEVEDAVRIPYADIPGFPRSTVASHAGMMLCGRLCGREVIVMAGRFHYYEGYAMEDVVLPTRVMAALGAQRLVLTNAAGGIGPDLAPGDLMLLTDHIASFVPSPLIGPNEEAFGPRFPDMTAVYLPPAAGEGPGRGGETEHPSKAGGLLADHRSPVRDPGGDPYVRRPGGQRRGHEHRL